MLNIERFPVGAGLRALALMVGFVGVVSQVYAANDGRYKSRTDCPVAEGFVERYGHCGQMAGEDFIPSFRKTPENLDYFHANGLGECGSCWDAADFPHKVEFAQIPSRQNAAAPIGVKPEQFEGPASELDSTGQALSASGFPGQQEVDSDRAYCEDSHQKAQVCCSNPIKCIAGIKGPSVGAINAVSTIALGALSVQNSGDDQKGIAENCKLMKNLAYGGAAANTALGAKCYSDKSTCEERCQEVISKYSQVLKDCKTLDAQWKKAGGNGSRCSAVDRQNYNSILATAAGRGQRCTSYNSQVAKMGSQAAQSIAASKIASLCESNAMAMSDDDTIDPVDFNGDCSDPVNASNPICVRCSGTNAQYDPLCRSVTGDRRPASAGSTFNSADFGTRRVDGSDLDVSINEDDNQEALFGNYDQQAKANAIPGNGGGFAGGSGGAGGFAGAGSGSGGGHQGGYDTDVLKGVSGRSGYSGSGMGVQSRSGFRGSFRPLKAEENNQRLDLKKYLPGGAKDPKRRSIAGLKGTEADQIGRSHENIFQRISKRVKILCKMKRLIDCR